MAKLRATFLPNGAPARLEHERFSIAVLPGDGIGPEVIAEAVGVLRAIAEVYGFGLDLKEGYIGQSALDQTGRMLPAETLRICQASQGVLLGPVGGSRWEHPEGINHPKQAVIKLRGWLGTYATLRPIRLYPVLAGHSPLKGAQAGFDILVVHDHASGLFYGRPRGIEVVDGQEVATNTQVYSAAEIERVAAVAFEEAKERRCGLVSVDMSKTLETGELWRDTVEALARSHPEVVYERVDADNFFFDLVGAPRRDCVVLADALLGQMIGATAAGLTGGYALHPAAFVGRDCVGLFQPSHGAAADIAGQGIADPIASIRAVALLLDLSLHLPEAAHLVEWAVEAVVREGALTPELAGEGQGRRTREVGEAVVEKIKSQVPSSPRV